MNVLSSVIIVVFAVIGVAAVFREISLRLFALRDDCTVMYITHIKTESENVELVLRSALAKRRWCGRKNAVSTVCLDAPLDDKTRRICETVCRDYGFAHLITKDEFLKTLE